MSIVRTKHHTVRCPRAKTSVVHTQCICNIFQCVSEKCRIRPLSGQASHFLIVKDCKHINILRWLSYQNPFETGKDTGEIIIARRHDKLVLHACQNRFLAVLDIQIIRQNFLCFESLCKERMQYPFCCAASLCGVHYRKERQHITLRAECHPFVYIAVHMDGKAWYQANVVF